MVFKRKGAEKLDAVVNIRLTSIEKARLKEDADVASLSMSELVRARYFGRPIVANATLVMVRELRRLGGLMKKAHGDSSGAYSHQTGRAISDIIAYIKKLSKT